ncbi:O-antigen translocase [Rhizobacter sp. Root404]|uniref:O-antigen translocase n=1 Tax=Rhizobacter sp. Root404 TaxID=1736528 RepID=UPI0009EBB448|nr:O-antigen translocase [Rhizobacter sp. Root404]
MSASITGKSATEAAAASADADDALNTTPDEQDAASRSYVQILVSSVLIGGSSIVNVAISIVRTKLLAVMLGPAGFGLLASFTVIAEMARSWAALGISSSGVRQIAASNGTGDLQKIALTVVVMRRTALVLGVLGAVGLAFASRPVSQLTFGSEVQASAVALLGLVVFFRMMSDAQAALLQGMRRIGDIARGGIIGTLVGSALMIGAVYWRGDQGLALALVLGAAGSTVILWAYSRRVQVAPLNASARHIRLETANLLRLGLAFLVSGLLMTGATYAVRVIVIKEQGLEAAGIYQAAWTLGGLYVGFILSAMGADFYPRLVGAAESNRDTNRLVNEQTRVSILLAAPGVIATLVFAPVCVSAFYTSDFAPAAEVLRWICMGMALRIISWPMGYIIVSRNHQLMFILTELAWVVVNVGSTFVLVKAWGIVGVGVAFFLSYVFHVAIIYPIARRISGLRWDPDNVRSSILLVGSMCGVTVGYAVLPNYVANSIGAFTALGACAYSIRNIATLVPPDRVPKRLRRLIYWHRRDRAPSGAPGVKLP